MTFSVMGFDGDVDTKEIGLSAPLDSLYLCEERIEDAAPEWMGHYRLNGGTGDLGFRCLEVRFVK